MKLTFTIFQIIVFSAFCFSQPEFTNNKDYHIKKVLKSNPEKAEKLWMRCASGDIEKLKKNITRFKNLKEIAITGGDERDDWTGAFESMAEIPSLVKVIFIKNFFGEIPSGTVLLKNIRSIEFYGSPQVQFDSCASTLAYLPELKELSFDLMWVDDIPQDLRSISNLQTVSFRFVTDFSAETDNPVYRDTVIPISGSGAIASLRLSAIESTLMREDIETILASFPGAIYEKPLPRKDDIEPATGKSDFTYQPVYKNVHPPAKQLDVQKEKYTVPSSVSTTLATESNTKITIPPNAFVDAKGNPVNGPVQIDYREFRDPLDFIFSGIPMSFDSSGHTSQFLSAGMFEMNASVNGKQVFLKKGAKIDVQLASRDTTPNYDLYFFNDSTGQWEKKPEKIQTASSSTDGLSEAMNAYWAYNRPPGSFLDSTTLDQRFQSMKYYYTKKSTLNDISKEKKNLFTRTWAKLMKNKPSLVKIVNTRTRKDSILFSVSRTNYRTNPEIEIYAQTTWLLKDNLSYKQFKKTISNTNHFFDVRIKNEEGAYLIKLKGRYGFKEINAVPVSITANNKITEMKEKQMSKQFRRYDKMLRSRQKIFDRNLKREKRGTDRNNQNLKNYSWQRSKSLMTKEEKKMSFDEWVTYSEDLLKNEQVSLASRGATTGNIIRSFSISGFGIWNCDQILRIQDPLEIFVDYRSKQDQKLHPSTTYVLNKNINGVLLYDSNGKIAISSSSQNAMITVSKDGDVAVALPENFNDRDFSSGKKYPFVMNQMDQKTTVADIRNLIGY